MRNTSKMIFLTFYDFFSQKNTTGTYLMSKYKNQRISFLLKMWRSETPHPNPKLFEITGSGSVNNEYGIVNNESGTGVWIRNPVQKWYEIMKVKKFCKTTLLSSGKVQILICEVASRMT